MFILIVNYEEIKKININISDYEINLKTSLQIYEKLIEILELKNETESK